MYAGVYPKSGVTGSGGVFKRTDGGEIWIPVKTGLRTGQWNDYVHALAIDPKSNTVYIGTGSNGVLVGSDEGID
jgi:hypothetical protein